MRQNKKFERHIFCKKFEERLQAARGRDRPESVLPGEGERRAEGANGRPQGRGRVPQADARAAEERPLKDIECFSYLYWRRWNELNYLQFDAFLEFGLYHILYASEQVLHILCKKKSRDAHKLREDEIALRACFLEKENAVLRAQVAALREEGASLRQMLVLQKNAH
ncbi:hypothetical protein JTE90_024186 [Oedothorax gibbosus]|uniref:BZIP domain-containing protein n=1 Tax=Oedothorax gibbosus TaxID=931172 RepID=A0AAV6UER7_9ARAC|nr:hypothetical protein JTE90_024186 [Oedothorax gibbosus]